MGATAGTGATAGMGVDVEGAVDESADLGVLEAVSIIGFPSLS